MALYSWRRCKQGRGYCNRVLGRIRLCRTRRCMRTSCPTRPRRRQLQIEKGTDLHQSTLISMKYLIFYVEHDFTCSIFYYFSVVFKYSTTSSLCKVRSWALCTGCFRIQSKCANTGTHKNVLLWKKSVEETYLRNHTKSIVHHPLTWTMLHDARLGFIVGTNTVHAVSLWCGIVTESWAHVVSMVTRDWAGGPFHPRVPGSIHWIGTTK